VHAANDDFIRRRGVRELEANVVYAVVSKPGAAPPSTRQ
jgi:hypothetical protein